MFHIPFETLETPINTISNFVSFHNSTKLHTLVKSMLTKKTISYLLLLLTTHSTFTFFNTVFFILKYKQVHSKTTDLYVFLCPTLIYYLTIHFTRVKNKKISILLIFTTCIWIKTLSYFIDSLMLYKKIASIVLAVQNVLIANVDKYLNFLLTNLYYDKEHRFSRLIFLSIFVEEVPNYIFALIFNYIEDVGYGSYKPYFDIVSWLYFFCGILICNVDVLKEKHKKTCNCHFYDDEIKNSDKIDLKIGVNDYEPENLTNLNIKRKIEEKVIVNLFDNSELGSNLDLINTCHEHKITDTNSFNQLDTRQTQDINKNFNDKNIMKNKYNFNRDRWQFTNNSKTFNKEKITNNNPNSKIKKTKETDQTDDFSYENCLNDKFNTQNIYKNETCKLMFLFKNNSKSDNLFCKSDNLVLNNAFKTNCENKTNNRSSLSSIKTNECFNDEINIGCNLEKNLNNDKYMKTNIRKGSEISNNNSMFEITNQSPIHIKEVNNEICKYSKIKDFPNKVIDSKTGINIKKENKTSDVNIVTQHIKPLCVNNFNYNLINNQSYKVNTETGKTNLINPIIKRKLYQDNDHKKIKNSSIDKFNLDENYCSQSKMSKYHIKKHQKTIHKIPKNIITIDEFNQDENYCSHSKISNYHIKKNQKIPENLIRDKKFINHRKLQNSVLSKLHTISKIKFIKNLKTKLNTLKQTNKKISIYFMKILCSTTDILTYFILTTSMSQQTDLVMYFSIDFIFKLIDYKVRFIYTFLLFKFVLITTTFSFLLLKKTDILIFLFIMNGISNRMVYRLFYDHFDDTFYADVIVFAVVGWFIVGFGKNDVSFEDFVFFSSVRL